MRTTSIVNYEALMYRIEELAKKTGRVTTRPLLLLFYVMTSWHTPLKEKMFILSALSYIVFPVDLLNAKRLPVIGWVDEIAALASAYQKVRKYITPEIEAKVDDLLDNWFPEYSEIALVIGHDE
ncbi:MAG: DUF1232 domain-containing protein [Prevotella sp.]|nr:DUF1232 domain-containing protein [Prevotella sp.]MBR3514254.1 DUF1232 domain-containing protein [Bacteroidaceae bacterium]